MQFSTVTTEKAILRQDRNDGWGCICARCGENIGLKALSEEGVWWFAIPRIPFAKGGGKTKDNCVILCDKCYPVIGQNNTEVITYSELPYFNP